MRKLQDIPNTDNPSTDYPKGRIRNRNEGSAIVGTPVIEELYGDIVQFFQKLVIDGNITENDLPDNHTNGYQLISALQWALGLAGYIKFRFGHLQRVGTDFNIPGAYDSADLAAINDNQIAFIQAGDGRLYTYEWDGDTWSAVGNYLAIGCTDLPRLCKMDDNKIAVLNPVTDRLSYYEWDGTDWSLVGNHFSLTLNVFGHDITKIDENTVAVFYWDDNELHTYEFDGSDWSLVGNKYYLLSSNNSISAMGVNKIAHFSLNNNRVQQYSWDGSDWSPVGNEYDTGSGSHTVLALNDSDVVLMNTNSNYAKVISFDGTDWKNVSTPIAIQSGGGSVYATSTVLPNGLIVYWSPVDEDISTMLRLLSY